MSSLQFWYEFASTYSYIAAERIEGVAAEAGVDIVWRPFLLGPIFVAQGWNTSPFNIYPAKGRYMWRDLERLAERYGLPPIKRPNPFPQNGLLAARVATIAAAEGWAPELTRAIYRAEFAEGRDIGTPAGLGPVISKIGRDSERIIERARTEETVKASLRAAGEKANRLGLFGAPSFVTPDGEVFWGQDRLEDAVAWAARTS